MGDSDQTSYNRLAGTNFASSLVGDSSDDPDEMTYTEGTTTFAMYSRIDSRQGSSNPFWRTLIRNRQNATTSFEGRRFNASYKDVTAQWDWEFRSGNNIPWQIRSYFLSGMPRLSALAPSLESVPAAVSSAVANRCISQFISKVNAAQSTLLGGEVVADWRRTINTVVNPMQSLRAKTLSYLTSMNKLKHRRMPIPSKRKAAADTYLEWQFGINPLVNDIAKGLADKKRFRFPVIPVYASAHQDYSGSNTHYQLPMPAGQTAMAVRGNYKSYSSYSLRYLGAVKSKSNDRGQISVAQAYRFLPKDFLPTAWNVLPYSWIADYFTNIGEKIEASCFCSSDLVWSCQTSKSSMIVDYGGLFIANSGSANQVRKNRKYVAGGNAHFEDVLVKRGSISAAALVPSLEVRLPFGGARPWANIAAVLLQAHKKCVPLW